MQGGAADAEKSDAHPHEASSPCHPGQHSSDALSVLLIPGARCQHRPGDMGGRSTEDGEAQRSSLRGPAVGAGFEPGGGVQALGVSPAAGGCSSLAVSIARLS